jgi:hypothetical protein
VVDKKIPNKETPQGGMKTEQKQQFKNNNKT